MIDDLTSEVFRNQCVFVNEGKLDLEYFSSQLKKLLYTVPKRLLF